MHLVIINGSPRVQKYSNTDKILSSFVKGFGKSGNTYELYSISNRSEWEAAKAAFENNTEILIAIPLYVENIPGILLEFLETLPAKKEAGTRISFILQSGFAEGCQLRCGEVFSKSMQILLQLMFRTFAKRSFKKVAKSWGCTRPITDRPYE